jgi:L-ascorbate metabolism protein UlaG (beta-lactamase superfamily)
VRRLAGRHAVIRLIVVWVVTAVTLFVLSSLIPEIDIPGWGSAFAIAALPSLGPGHLDPRRAAETLRLLHPRLAVPIHWGTYAPLGFGRLQTALLADPVTEFRRHAAELAPEVEVRVLDLGGTLHLDAVAGGDQG